MAKDKNTIWWIVGIIAIIFILSGTQLPQMQSIVNDTATTSSGHGGGGGGGGSGGGDGGTIPDEGFQCDNCESQFLVGNPNFVTETYLKPTFFQRIGIAPKPQGHWNCIGTCIYNGVDLSETYNCVPDPESEIPDDEFDDIAGEKPDCWCLKKESGPCNWYDSNYGEGLDDYQCGGSCPVGETCTEIISGTGKKQCECTAEGNHAVGCGFNLPISLRVHESETCYGDCPSGEICTYTPASLTMISDCSCKPKETEEDQGCTDTDSGMTYTLQGICDSGAGGKQDTCVDGFLLDEFYCSPFGCARTQYDCRNLNKICSHGACVSIFPTGLPVSTSYINDRIIR